MSWFHGLRERMIDFLHPARRDRELAEEMQLHIELETVRQRARGLDATIANEAAMARFGKPIRVSDATRDVRGTPLLSGGMKDISWAIRSLRRHPAFAVLSVLTIAVGIGATTAAFAVFDTLLLRKLPFREPDRLVMIEERTSAGAVRPPSYPNFNDWRTSGKLFDGVASQMYPLAGTATVGEEPVRVSMIGLSRNFFAIVGAPLAHGREFTLEENAPGGPDAVMVSYDFWKTRMNGRPELGTIRLGAESVPVVGVAPPNFRLVNASDLYFAHERGPGTFRNAHNYVVVGRLRAGATLELARHDMQGLSRTLKAMYGSATEADDVVITPLHGYLVRRFRILTGAVFAASALVLLIACTNLLSAQLARGMGRAREVAVRVALGASRSRLVRQLLVESSVIATVGAAFGTAFALALTKVVQLLGVAVVPALATLTIDARVLGFSVAATALTSLLIGLYPAFRLTRPAHTAELRAGRGNTGAETRTPLWSLLVGFEIATAVILLVGCTLLVRTVHNILSSDVGFDANGVITASFDPQSTALPEMERIVAELSAIPGAESAALTTTLPLSWGDNSAPVVRPTDPPDVWPALAGFRVITPDYFRVLKQPIVQGRGFTSADVRGSLPVAIVTPGIAKALWPNEPAIGKLVRTTYLGDQWLTVVGVAGEATSWTMPRGTQNEIFTPLAQQHEQARQSLIALIRTPELPGVFMPLVRSRMKELAPAIAVRLGSIQERINRSVADRRLGMIALMAFAGVALVLAGIGIYGVMSYSVAARRPEIGVRIALGAAPGTIQRQVLQAAMQVAAGGVSAGLVGCVFASTYLESVLYGVNSIDPIAYGIGIVVLLLTALFGAYVPAHRSSTISPLEAIRGE